MHLQSLPLTYLIWNPLKQLQHPQGIQVILCLAHKGLQFPVLLCHFLYDLLKVPHFLWRRSLGGAGSVLLVDNL